MIYIVKRRKIWFTISAILVATSIFALVFWGLNLGIDFTGGSLLEVKFNENRPSVDEIQFLVAEQDLGEILVQPMGEQNIVLRLKTITEEEHQELFSAMAEKYSDISEERFDSIGPVIGAELQKKSLTAIILVIIAIALYIAFAFRKVSYPIQSWKYGLVTLFALFHDVIIPLGVFAVLGKFLNIEIGSAFVAAMLTVLGYSVNDTIVVFDRVRENLIRGGGEFEGLVEKSVNQTLGRSINTTLTTLVVLFAVFFLGGETVKIFALALIIGVGAGAYSSIFIASPLLVSWY
ncbi:MAG: protein translocase subunit SecF, partial [Patescibacteria group bacterium]|nr:protein translocase subunit SecF [Patescibacteria group bacterium]